MVLVYIFTGDWSLVILPGHELPPSLWRPALTQAPSGTPVSAPAPAKTVRPQGGLCRSEEEAEIRNNVASTFQEVLT